MFLISFLFIFLKRVTIFLRQMPQNSEGKSTNFRCGSYRSLAHIEYSIFIRPESDHWLPLSVTIWLPYTSMQIGKLKFGHKVKFSLRLWAQGLVKLKLRQDLEADKARVQSLHYRLRCSLGRFLSQKKFKSKVLFLSEKQYICPDQVALTRLWPRFCTHKIAANI